MRTMLFALPLLWACSASSSPAGTPEAQVEADPYAAEEDLGRTAPGRLHETLMHEAHDDPNAPAEPEGEEAEQPSEGAEPTEVPTTEAAEAAPQPTLPTPSAKTPPPCEGLSGDLAKAAGGDTAGLALDADGRVQVAWEFTGSPALPQGCEQETAAMGHGQGWCDPAQLCALAGTDGITRVRTPRRASPK
jgi:hypothetical protein